MSEYDKIADRARAHTPLVPCIACRQAAWIAKYGWRGAVLPTIGCTCTAAAAPDLLAALEGMQQANGCFDGCHGPDDRNHVRTCQDARFAIAKARGSV